MGGNSVQAGACAGLRRADYRIIELTF